MRAYFLAKIRFDTTENEPAKFLQQFANFANFANPNPPNRASAAGPLGLMRRDMADGVFLPDLRLTNPEELRTKNKRGFRQF